MGAFDDLIPAASGGAFDDLIPGRKAGAGGVAAGTGTRQDLLKSLERGLLKLPGQTAGLLDIPAALTSGDRPITRAADWIGKTTGFQPGKWADEIAFSPGYVASAQDIAPAWAPVEQALADPTVSKADFARTVVEHLPEIAGKYAEHPAYSLNQAVESVPGMIVGGALSRALMTAGRAPGVAGGLERVAGKWAAPIAGGFGEGAMQAGHVMAEYKGTDQRRAAIAALASGGLDALLAVGGGRLANKLGLETPETLMAKIGDKTLAGATAKGTATAAAKLAGGAAGEGALQELPQSMQEQAWQNWADGKPLGEGVLRAGVEGGITGAMMGAGSNVPGAARALIPLRDDQVVPQRDQSSPPGAGAPPAIPAAEVLDEPKPTAAEKALEPRKLTDLDRVAEIDRLLAAMPVQETGTTPERAALEQERADLSRNWPATVKGQPTTFSTEAGARVEGQYALIEASDLQASHDTDLRPNPAYPADLQPRDRTRAASEAQIASIVGRLDPARLGQSATAADGAPIIGADGLVESGNARTIALQRVYRANGQKAENYKAWLREASAAVGMSPEQVDAMRQPVLVRVRTTPVNRAEFARQANASTVAVMSPLEQARADAARIDALDDLRPDEQGDFATSREFIRRFVGRLPATEQAGMIDSGGQLSASGYARVRNAVLAKAYGDSPVLTRLVESMDDNLRNVSRALMIAAPRVAQARSAIQAGRRFDADITPHLVGAVEELGRIKDAGGSVADALAQAGLMGDERTPEARDLLAFLAENVRRPRRLAEFITAYFDALDAAGDPAQGSLMGEAEPPSTGKLMAAVRREQGEKDAAANAATTARNAGGRLAGEVTPAAARAAGGPAAAPGGGGGAQGNAAPQAANVAPDEEWRAFAPETGTLGVPRAEMPQVKVARRPELFEFLQGRGIGHQRVSLPADSLKPTQAEYSPAKTDSAAHLADEQTDRAAVLVSSDGYVLDGHHRWLARADAHQPVWAVQFDAPIGRLLDAVMQFPGVHVSKDSEGAVTPSARDLAVQDLKDAVGELGDFLTRHMRAAIVEEDKPRIMPILIKAADAAIRIVGTDLRRVVAWMRDHFRRNKGTLPGWNTIPATWYREASEKALAGLEERGQQVGLFDDKELVQADLFGAPQKKAEAQAAQPEVDAATAARPAAEAPSARSIALGDVVAWRSKGRDVIGAVVRAPDVGGYMQVKVQAAPARSMIGKTFLQHVGNVRGVPPKAAMIDGRPYDYGPQGDNFKPPRVEEFLSKDEIAHADGLVERYYTNRPAPDISAEDRARAEALLQPLLDKAKADKAVFDQKIVDIAKRAGAMGQMLPPEVKGVKRAAEKLVVEENFNLDGMKDLLRSTIVVSNYAEAQRVLDEIVAEFKLLRAPKNRTGGTPITLDDRPLVEQDAAQFGGYTDLMVNVRMPSGVIAEIQINVPEMLGAKEAQGHKLYEAAREAPKDSPLGVEIIDAMRGFYDPVSAAVQRRLAAASASSPAGSDENVTPPRGAPARPGAMLGRGSSVEPSSESLNQPLPGMSTNQSPPKVGTNSEPIGNLSGTLIASTPPIVPAEGENPYTSTKGESSDVDTGEHPAQGTPPSESAGSGRPGGRTGGASGRRGAGSTAPGEVGPPGADGVRGPDEDGNASGAGSAHHASGGVPAGRLIPAKSGRNYRFTDEDIPTGSWFKRATRNLDAILLLRKLEAEKRQATPDEQRVLAQFSGWGASELANKLFDDRKAFAAGRALKALEDAKAGVRDGRLTTSSGNPYWVARAALDTAGKLPTGPYGAPIPASLLTPANFGITSDAARWIDLRDKLKEALTDDEWAAASRSTQYAHYTSHAIVRSMWGAMQRFGFNGGLVFEPGAGTGIFPGLMPVELATNSAYVGVEYDPITGGILAQLQPDERTLVESFVDTKLPREFFDIAIGNPPFSATKILADPDFKKYAFSLHDYFFAKTLDRVRPGGIVAFVTSRFTMDKAGDKARQFMAERADLIGAIRLPQTAFKANAGTEVVTDVLFLRKKDGHPFEQAQPWLNAVPIETKDGPAVVNEYFAAHPEMVLGTPALAGKMYSKNEYTVLPPEGDIEALFSEAVQRLPADVYATRRGGSDEAASVREVDFNPAVKKEGNYYLSDKGVLMQREGGVGHVVELKSQAQGEIIRSYIPLRDALKQAQYDQLNGGDWETSLAALQKAYKTFTDKHGRVNQVVVKVRKVKADELDDNGMPTGRKFDDEQEQRSYPIQAALIDDPDHTLVMALESVNEDTGVISDGKFLTGRVLGALQPPRIETPQDALLASLNDLGKVDLPHIAHLANASEADVESALAGAIYLDPAGNRWVTADEYLSGEVKRKLAEARAAAESDRRFAVNIPALEAVQPAALTPASINLSIGMNWIPGSDYARFLRETTGVRASVEWDGLLKRWSVDEISGGKTPEATSDWGTLDRNAADLLLHALTGRPIKVTRTEGSGSSKKTVTDVVATEAANEKLQKLRDAFSAWVWKDPARTDRLVREYNDRFNTTVPRSFDGRHLRLPGVSTQYHIFDHVKRAAWRIIQTGNTYLAHAVGAGKTFETVIAAMEMKRLGMVSKPMVVVPNHMLQQFAREWQDLYPTARLMVADEQNFHTENRRRFVARAALSDLDGIVITHSAFKLLDIDPAYKDTIIERQVDLLRAALDNAEEAGERITVKRLETQVERLEQKMAGAMSSARKDKNARFDEMGVDFLFVDEAHEFRKLDFATSRSTKGISPEGSARALDLFIKTRWLEEKHPGRSLVMMSGTPITNTVAELYSVQRFMNLGALERRGLDDFDSWAAMFGRERTELEPNAAGAYEPTTRFSDFVNVPELTQMFREFADVLTADHLAAMLGDKRPAVEGGSRKMVVTPKSEAYATYQKVLAKRVEISRKFKPTKEQPGNPDPLMNIITDGRLAAIDMRFAYPGSASDPDSKLNRMADDVIAAFHEGAGIEYLDKAGKVEAVKGDAMMVFSDLGFGAGVAASRGFNARAWFEKRLRDGGVPRSAYAFMSDYKKSTDKAKLFKDVNAGRVRILIGSSKNMGTGVNAQQRLRTMFHLDSPWFPADLEQREGRAVRQGNKNKSVRIRAYAAKGTYDENMWKMLATKQLFIDKALSGDTTAREIEDLSSVSQYDLAAAMIAEDPRVIELAGAKADVERLLRLYQAHEDQRFTFRDRVAVARREIASIERDLPSLDAEAAKVRDLTGDRFVATEGGKTYTERVKWGQAVVDRFNELTKKLAEPQQIGEISGFPVLFRSQMVGKEYQSYVGVGLPHGKGRSIVLFADTSPMSAVMQATGAIVDLARAPQDARANLVAARNTVDSLTPRLDTQFPMLQQLSERQADVRRLEEAIAAGPARSGAESTNLAQTGAPEANEADLIFAPMSRAQGRAGGMELPAVQAIADRVAKALPGLPPVKVLASPDDAPAPLRAFIASRNASGDVEGALHDGAIYLFAGNLADEGRAEHVLAKHEAAHAGLRGLMDDAALQQSMRAIYATNAEVRRAARGMIDAGMSEAEAVEEVLVDMPDAELATLKGWRAFVGRLRDGLRSRGFARLAGMLDDWLAGSLTQQQRADLFAADLVRAARRYVADRNARSMADDAAAQEKWLASEAHSRGFKDIDELVERAYPVFEKLADTWRQRHPASALMSRGLGRIPLVSARSQLESDANRAAADLARAVTAGRAKAPALIGRTPHVLSALASAVGLPNQLAFLIDETVINKVWFGKHADEMAGVTPAMLVRAMYRPAAVVADRAQSGSVSLVTNILTPLGPVVVSVNTKADWQGSAAAMVVSAYPRQKGEVADWIRGTAAGRDVLYVDEQQIGEAVTGNLNPENADATRKGWRLVSARGEITGLGHDAGGPPSPRSDESIVSNWAAPVNANYRGLATVQAKLEQRLAGRGMPKAKTYADLLRWIDKHWTGDAGDKPRFSLATTPAATAQVTAAQRAEALIQNAAGSPKPLDAFTRMLTRVSGLERLTTMGYGLGARLIDRITPERVKAGLVSDYGVPEAVIDQRAMLQGRQREQLREAGKLLEKLATMTRAESRIAYEWMHGEDTRTADELLADLPAESVAVLRQVRALVDELSQEAVKLGQLDPEDFKRHRFAYLRRSYFKHAAELTGAEKTARQRAISILGDQYRGRGISLAAPMRQMQNIAPEWWKRKLAAGKADTSLKGEKFERLERRAPIGAGTAQIPGLDGERRPGRVLEVHYWPAGEPKPAKYADWDSAGTFEAIDTKGGNVVLWRDFTKEERVKMGEIDEARYAIAKTLQRMIHDVEVGRYLQWLSRNHAKNEGEPFAGTIVPPSERYLDSFKPHEWVRVPDATIAGTHGVKKYGALAGKYLPGPIWNDLRQVVGGRFMPLGQTYHDILRLWKMSKTALSPAVHMNNVMANAIMADWHDVSAGHVAKALRIVLGASARDWRGVLGRAGNAAGGLGIADRDVAREILTRYENSGGAIGGWVAQEIADEQLAPIVDALRRELASTAAAAAPAEIGVYSALQHALHARFPQAWQAFKASRPASAVATDAKNLIDLYQAEDDVFRLAAWLKAKEGGASDAEAGKTARRSFLDYSINAPWVQAMRSTAFPFISFSYRAVPMLIETAAKRPHKILKLMMVLGALNAIGGMLAGGGGDDEDKARKLLPDEKAGRIWGLVPKLIRMPWNDAHGSPVLLDIRRWIPVGDVLDLGQGHAALPVPPALMPGGPLAVLGEIAFNRSMFTGKPINLETDTALEQAGKIADHLWKAATPNVLGVPGTYATQGVADAVRGRTDAFGRELSVPQALASSVGVKLGSYPTDVLRRNQQSKARAELAEIDDQMRALTRQRVTNRIDQDEYEAAMRRQNEKKRRVAQELAEKVN